MERERLIGWLRTYADSHEGVSAHRDIMRRAADELQTVRPEAPSTKGDKAIAILQLLAVTEPIRRWKEYEERGEQRIPCFMAVEVAAAVAEFVPDIRGPQSRSPSEEK